MKFHSFITLVILVFSLSMQAQTTRVFELDLASPHKDSFRCVDGCKHTVKQEDTVYSYQKRLTIPSKNLIALKLINANPFKYQYTLNGTGIDLFVENQGDFTGLQDRIEGAVVPAQSNPTLEDPKPSDSIQQLEEQIKKIEEAGLDKAMPEDLDDEKVKQLEEFSNSCSEICGAIQKEVLSEISVLESKAEAIPNILTDFKTQPLWEDSVHRVDAQIDAVIARKKRLSSNIRESLDEEKAISQSIKDRKKRAFEGYKKAKENIEKLKKELEAIEKEENEARYKLAIIEIEKATIVLEDLNSEMLGFLGRLRLEDAMNKAAFMEERQYYEERFINVVAKMNQFSLLEASQLSKTYIEKYNTALKETFEKQVTAIEKQRNSLFSVQLDYYTKVMDFDGQNIDLIQLKLTQTPKSDGYAQSKDYDYNVWVTRGFKIDVSAGAFLSSLANEDFEIGMQDGMRVINQVNVGRYEYGFGSVANLSYRTGAWVKPTFSFGAMFTTDTQFQFLVGGGFILGKMNRFVFHYGLSVGRVDRLKDQFTPNENGLIVLEDDNLGDGNITVPELRLGQFFGITYNLGETNVEMPEGK